MLIFTYCSCRSSRYGYQYSYFSSECTETIYSLLSSELSESNAIHKEFIKWCENYSGWQLALRQGKQKDKFLLMVGQLEKSRELEKKIQIKRGNAQGDLNSLDSDYYMTLGFLGSSQEIKKLTVFMMREYMKDGYRSLFNRLEGTINKTDDATRYVINTKAFNSIFCDLPEISLSHSVGLKPNGLFNNLILKSVMPTDTYLSSAKAQSKKTSLPDRKKSFEKCIEMISDFENLSGILPLLIAYDYFRIDTRIYVRIDYDYLWKYDGKV